MGLGLVVCVGVNTLNLFTNKQEQMRNYSVKHGTIELRLQISLLLLGCMFFRVRVRVRVRVVVCVAVNILILFTNKQGQYIKPLTS